MTLKSIYLSALSLFFFTVISAQIPNGYYDSAKNLSDENLKSALNQIIDNHTEYTYTSSSTDVSELKGIYLVNILSQEKRITKILVIK